MTAPSSWAAITTLTMRTSPVVGPRSSPAASEGSSQARPGHEDSGPAARTCGFARTGAESRTLRPVPAESAVRVRPIAPEDLARVGAYLHRGLNPRLSASAWAAALVPPWPVAAPNHGFMLLAGDEVVGVNAAIYSSRVVRGERREFCNVAALCVDETARPHAVRLIRSILRQPGYHFTDLSPSGNVVELDRRLGFQPLPTATAVAVNLPRLDRRFRLLARPGEIESTLAGVDKTVYADHRSAAAARHLVVTRGDDYCYVVFRKDRRKGLPLFATVLHVSDRDLFAAAFGVVAGHFLRRHGALCTLVEERVAPVPARLRRMLAQPRPKMFKSDELVAADIDDLYSELTCVAW